MKPPIKKVNFGDVVEIVDPKSGQFREKLASKAGMLAETMIDDAMDEDDIRVRATALNAYSKYRYIEANDSSVLLDKIVNMSEKQINMLERALKQKVFWKVCRQVSLDWKIFTTCQRKEIKSKTLLLGIKKWLTPLLLT